MSENELVGGDKLFCLRSFHRSANSLEDYTNKRKETVHRGRVCDGTATASI